MHVLFIILIFNFLGWNDSIEDGWQGIKPLETSKATVDSLWKYDKTDENNYLFYSSDELPLANVNYTTAPCQPNNYKRGV